MTRSEPTTRAVCPGSFDPVTHGHLDVIRRAAGLFDEVVVAVGVNSTKRGLFPPVERVTMLQESLGDLAGVRVRSFEGLLVDLCREEGATAVVKGLRSGADLEAELPMARLNTRLSGVETLWLPAAPEWADVSSTLVREIARLGGDVSGLVPEPVARRLRGLASDPGAG